MKTQALKGMRDLLPNEQTLRDYIQYPTSLNLATITQLI